MSANDSEKDIAARSVELTTFQRVTGPTNDTSTVVAAKKIFHDKTFELGASFDNSLRASLSIGLNYFHIPSDPQKRAKLYPQGPSTWPLLIVSCDEGSDGKAMLYALQSPKWNLNIMARFDPNHGLWNSIKAAMKAPSVGLWALALLSAIAWNMPHLPYNDDRFHYEVKNSVKQYFEDNHVGPDNAFFQMILPGLLHDLREDNDFPTPEKVNELYDNLIESYPWFKLGDRVSQNRFLQFITCLLYTSPSPRDGLLSRMPSSA